MGTTLEQLRLATLQRADMVDDPLIVDPSDASPYVELDGYINDARKELRLRYCAMYPDAYLTFDAAFTITSTGNTHALPANFLKSRGLDIIVADHATPVPLFNFRERGRRRGFRTHRVDSVIRIEPVEHAQGTYQLLYIPTPTLLVAPTDQLDPIEDLWSEFVSVSAAIPCLIKARLDTSDLERAKTALIQRMETEAGNRDSEPEQSADVYGSDFYNGDPAPYVS